MVPLFPVACLQIKELQNGMVARKHSGLSCFGWTGKQVNSSQNAEPEEEFKVSSVFTSRCMFSLVSKRAISKT